MQIGTKDLDRINPDWKFAYFHAKSTKPGHCSEDCPELCQCCLNIIHKQAIPLNVHSKDLQFLGFGFPLWFSFLKNCALLVLVLIISQSIVSVFMAVKYNRQECSEQYKKLFQQKIDIINIPNILNHRRFSDLQEKNHLRSLISLDNNYYHVLNEDQPSGSNQQQTNEIQNKQQETNKHGQTPQTQEQGHHHHDHRCTGVFILLSRRQDKITDLQQILRVSSFFITLFTLLFIRDTIYKTQQYYDERKCTLGDFSILISKLPKILGIQASLRKFMEEGFSQPFQIQQMILIPQLEELQAIQQQQTHHMKKLQEIHKKKDQHKFQSQNLIKEIQKQIEALQKREQQQTALFRHQLKIDKLCSERIILVLNSQPQKQRLLDQFDQLDKHQLKKYFGDQGTQIQIQQAPQPRQIIWQNVNYPTSQRFGRIVLGWTLSALFITIITIIFYFILKKKSEIVQHKEDVKSAAFIVYTSLIAVILFNKFVMGVVLHHFTDLQKHSTSDNFQFSFAFKYALGMFFTTALMTLFVEAFSFQNFDKHPYGVIQEQSIMFFMNSLLVPLIWLINPFQIIVLIKRKINFGKKHLTQREANHLMEDFNYDIGKRYAQVLQTIWFTFLYISLIPMGSFLTLIGIVLYYWVDKYNLLRRSSIHQNVSGKLAIIALKLLDLILIFMPLGWMVFDYYLKKQHKISTQSIIFLLIGLLYISLPWNKIIDYFYKQSFNPESKSYKEVKHSFKDTYFNLHPLYSKTHEEENTLSRKIFKQEVLKQIANPIFSFAQGWLAKNNAKKNIQLSKNSVSGRVDEQKILGNSNLPTKRQSQKVKIHT